MSAPRPAVGGLPAQKTNRAVFRNGRLELLEPLDLPEGALVEVIIRLAIGGVVPSRAPVVFATWDLGVLEPITREAIYGDDLM